MATPVTPSAGSAPPADDAFEIRLVRTEDVDSLHRNCLRGWPLEELRAEVARNVSLAETGERFHFVAVGREGDLRGEVVGTAYLDRETHPLQRRRGQLVGVSVTGPYRRRGVARRLNEAVRERAAALGLVQLLTACRGGEAAEAVWKALGYVEYGRLPGGYDEGDGRTFDQVLLECPVTEEVVFTRQGPEVTRVDLVGGGRSLSQVEIEPLTLRYGVATVPAAYVGGVETAAPWRRRGYARRLILAALERARGEGAAVALLYGIGDFYHRFGYTTVGAGYELQLRHADEEAGTALPEGWRVRGVREEDLPALQRLYAADAGGGTGPVVRPPEGKVWGRLRALCRGEREGDECRVAVRPAGEVGGYVWRGRGCWPVDHAQDRYWPQDLAIGEAVAVDPAGADAVLATCRRWAAEEGAARGRRVETVHLGVAPDGAVAAAAQHQDATAVASSWRSAGPQVRTLDAFHLLAAIAPELSRVVAVPRDREAWRGRATIVTDAGAARLESDGDGVRVSGAAEGAGGLRIEIGQTTLVRLVLGAFPARDLLARSEPHLPPEARDCLVALFPRRHPYVYLLDR